MFKRLVEKVLRKLRYCGSVIASGPYLRCPTCSNLHYRGKYCDRDGTRLVKVPRCTCGHPIFKYAAFCPECGIEIKKEVQPSCQE